MGGEKVSPKWGMGKTLPPIFGHLGDENGGRGNAGEEIVPDRSPLVPIGYKTMGESVSPHGGHA